MRPTHNVAENQTGASNAALKPSIAAVPRERRALGSLQNSASTTASAAQLLPGDSAPEYCSAPAQPLFSLSRLPRDPHLRVHRRFCAEASALHCSEAEPACPPLQPLALRPSTAACSGLRGAAAAGGLGGAATAGGLDGTAAAGGGGGLLAELLCAPEGDGLWQGGVAVAAGAEEGEELTRLFASGLLEPGGDSATPALLNFSLGPWSSR